MAIVACSCYMVRYNVPGPIAFHERLCGAVSNSGLEAFIRTPDDDRYAESITPDADIHSVILLDGQGENRAGIPANRVYRMRDVGSDADLYQFGVEAAAHYGRGPPAMLRVVFNIDNEVGRAVGAVDCFAAAAAPTAAVAHIAAAGGGLAALAAAVGA